ncbi:hypothetical protein [Streptomyces chartreusis]|uniref:hypothetical protein n=1 Tax=Streptomyces chartreusis TaxID=1969 RepID=UPI003821CC2A
MQQQPQDSPAREPFDWQLLLGFGAGLLGLFFVLLNAGYVHFYEELSVRPEEVGFDRVGVLARTAGIALTVSIVLSAVVAITYSIPIFKGFFIGFFLFSHKSSLLIFYAAFAGLFIYGFIADLYWVQGIVIPFILLLFCFAFFTVRKHIGPIVIVPSIVAGVVALCFIMRAEYHAVEFRLTHVANGHPVAPVKLLNFPILDITAEPAQATPLDSSKKLPIELMDPYLLFLGKGPSGVALVGCGNTIIMPTDSISVHTGAGIDFRNYSNWRNREKAKLRWVFCQCVHANEDGCERLMHGESGLGRPLSRNEKHRLQARQQPTPANGRHPTSVWRQHGCTLPYDGSHPSTTQSRRACGPYMGQLTGKSGSSQHWCRSGRVSIGTSRRS